MKAIYHHISNENTSNRDMRPRGIGKTIEGQLIYILSDSQAALHTFAPHQIISKGAYNCMKNLRILAKHFGAAAGENQLALLFFTYTGPELVITKIAIHGTVADWITNFHQVYWNNVEQTLSYTVNV